MTKEELEKIIGEEVLEIRLADIEIVQVAKIKMLAEQMAEMKADLEKLKTGKL